MLLRLLQRGEQLGMPQAEPLPDVGKRCSVLRVRDAGHNWRIIYRIDRDAVLILEVYVKKTPKIPHEVIERWQDRLKRYDEEVKAPKSNPGSEDTLMDVTKRKAIEAAGWKVGDAADLLGMSDEERQLLDTRVELAQAVRRQREALHLSQKQLGAMLKTSQPRVAKIERAASDVSMDQLIRAFTAAGGRIVVKTAKSKAKKGQKATAAKNTLVLEVTTSE